MNYCTIQEAWGKQIEQFTNNDNENQQNRPSGHNISNSYSHNNSNNNNNNNNHSPSNNNSHNHSHNHSYSHNSENNNDETFNYNKIKQNNSYNINYDETCNCDILFNHIKKCPKCYNKIKNYFRPKIIEYYHNIIDDNKDIITLILIGLFILLFYKLINNLTKS